MNIFGLKGRKIRKNYKRTLIYDFRNKLYKVGQKQSTDVVLMLFL